jgi:mono/diheme cytochrome c family protein
MHRGTVVVLTLLAGVVVVAGIAVALIYSGSYDIGADAPHAGPIFALLETARAHSIRAHAQYLEVPSDLNSNRRVSSGAAEYGEMCSQCHLAPGMERTEISKGLYPAAPELARGDALSPAEQFWVIKHGIKFTAMPAWGPTHDEDLIWDIVAFVRRLPALHATQYRSFVAQAPEEHANMMHHDPMMRGMPMQKDAK